MCIYIPAKDDLKIHLLYNNRVVSAQQEHLVEASSKLSSTGDGVVGRGLLEQMRELKTGQRDPENHF